MKNTLIFIMICFAVISCGPSQSEKSEADRSDYAMADSISAPAYETGKSAGSTVYDEPVTEEKKMEKSDVTTGGTVTKSTSTVKKGIENLSDTIYLKNVRLSKKFIKTADYRFKVKNVEKSTDQIENLARKVGGYVQQSNIRSNYVYGRTVEVSKDTMVTVFEYYVDNHLIIRVPSIYFDSVMAEIANLHIYLDYRNIKTEDVSTIFLRNKLKAEKKAEYEKRIQRASDMVTRKLDDIVEAERQASELADIAIEKKIENYELQDRIDFSTITLDLYQANSVYEQRVENTKLYEYQPNFWQRAWQAIRTGWNAILTVIIGLLYLWPLYILAILIYYGIKYLRKRFKKPGSV